MDINLAHGHPDNVLDGSGNITLKLAPHLQEICVAPGRQVDINSYLVISDFNLDALPHRVQAKESLSNAKIEIVDSLTGSIGLVWPLIKVLEAAKNGASLPECKSLAERASKNTGLLLVPETLEYLHRGGRIGSAAKFIGTALNFKPLLEIVDGGFVGLERVRTHKKALDRLLKHIADRIGERRPVYLAATHIDAPQKAAELFR